LLIIKVSLNVHYEQKVDLISFKFFKSSGPFLSSLKQLAPFWVFLIKAAAQNKHQVLWFLKSCKTVRLWAKMFFQTPAL